MAILGTVSSISRTGAFEPFDLQVSRGQITFHTPAYPFGINTSIASGVIESVWSAGGAYSFPAAASVLTVVSDSADDDGSPAGTGANTVVIEGLDANYLPVSATVIMNGTSSVSTTGVSFLRVNRAYVATAGSTKSNVGNITIANSTPTTLAYIGAAFGVAEQCIYTVPAGHTAYISNVLYSSYSSTATAAASFLLYTTPFGGATQLVQATRVPATGVFEYSATYPFAVFEKSDIDIRAAGLGGTINVSSQLQILLVKNEYEIVGG